MKIGVFAYNFKHWKTQAGIQNLILNGNKPCVVFAANPVELKFYRSKIRTTPKDLFLSHPRQIAEQNNIDYYVVKHNSNQTSELVEKYDLDLGIILGARILKPLAFSNFKKGVLNMHPGILPENRGLDTIKWAIEKDMPQGVTAHIIDKNIDRGLLVSMEKIKIYEDDTLLDLQIRIQNLEQKLMIDSIKLIQERDPKMFEKVEKGNYHKSMPSNIENNLLKKFIEYRNARSSKKHI